MEQNINIRLRCATCGDENSFEYNEDLSYVKCIRCGCEYKRGYDELVERNQEAIEDAKGLLVKNIEEEIVSSLKSAFKGNKSIKFKP